jgi:hypothetical protein
MSAEEKRDELKSFEAALAALMPRTDRLDRERLMFLAGQQSVLPSTFGRGAGGEGKKRFWAWPAAFAGMSVVAATLFVMLISRPGSGGVENVVRTSAPQAVPEDAVQEITDTSDYAEPPRKYISYFDLAFLSGGENRKNSEAESPYPNASLLRQILAKGVDSWKPSEMGHIDGETINTRPLTNRELMKQLLDQGEAGPS